MLRRVKLTQRVRVTCPIPIVLVCVWSSEPFRDSPHPASPPNTPVLLAGTKSLTHLVTLSPAFCGLESPVRVKPLPQCSPAGGSWKVALSESGQPHLPVGEGSDEVTRSVNIRVETEACDSQPMCSPLAALVMIGNGQPARAISGTL